ncbi:MAG: hypothetical protein H6706_14550 [Myxococcales bacterium]|nr:hypothetical protein [Myxococcales bacterium]
MVAWLGLLGCDDAGDGGGDPAVDAAVVADAAGDARIVDEGIAVDQGPDAAAVDAGPDAAPADAAPPADADVDAATPDAEPPPALIDAPCAPSERVGGFSASLEDGYTAVQGQVTDAVIPGNVARATAAEGACELLQPPGFFCDPACAVGTSCGEGGACVAQPQAVDVGGVTVTGLEGPVAMAASAPVWFYTFRGSLPHPGFLGGAAVRLEAAGAGEVAPFSLRGQGVDALVPAGATVDLAAGQPFVLRWEAAAEGRAGRIHVDLNIANHGGTPARIECTVPDTGEFQVPQALTDALVGLGASGFPRVILTRRTVDSAQTAVGCVDFEVRSAAVIDVNIPGLISCSFDDDCPEGQICRPDLTCGGEP